VLQRYHLLGGVTTGSRNTGPLMGSRNRVYGPRRYVIRQLRGDISRRDAPGSHRPGSLMDAYGATRPLPASLASVRRAGAAMTRIRGDPDGVRTAATGLPRWSGAQRMQTWSMRGAQRIRVSGGGGHGVLEGAQRIRIRVWLGDGWRGPLPRDKSRFMVPARIRARSQYGKGSRPWWRSKTPRPPRKREENGACRQKAAPEKEAPAKKAAVSEESRKTVKARPQAARAPPPEGDDASKRAAEKQREPDGGCKEDRRRTAAHTESVLLRPRSTASPRTTPILRRRPGTDPWNAVGRSIGRLNSSSDTPSVRAEDPSLGGRHIRVDA